MASLLEQPQAEPGYFAPSINPEIGECMRRAVACVTGWHPFHIPWVDSKKGNYWEWEAAWHGVLSNMGWSASVFHDNDKVQKLIASGLVRDRLWIGCVNAKAASGSTYNNGAHAIVMLGDAFYWDSNEGNDTARVQKPHSFQGGWVLKPA